MKTIFLEEKNCLSAKEAEDLLGDFLNENHYNVLVNEDCDVYKPNTSLFDDNNEENCLLKLRKNVFPKDMTRKAWENLRLAATPTNNRGMAAGPIDPELVAAGKIVMTSKNLGQLLDKDGNVLNQTVANSVDSGIAGYMDRYSRQPYCRLTAFGEHHREKYESSIPFIQAISEQFKRLMPNRWNYQYNFSQKTKDFVIPNTVFSTITVNKNFRTAAHTDRGDLSLGFGNLTVLESPEGFDGGYLIFPRYKVAVNVREGDFLAADVHEVHGNTQITGKEKHERISVVCYYREKMKNCGSREDEEKLRETFKRTGKLGYHHHYTTEVAS